MMQRPPSLLTDAQREFLQTEVPESDYERSQRSKIQRRVQAGLNDLKLVIEAVGEGRLDVSDIMEDGRFNARSLRQKTDREVSGEYPPPAWPLAALLFAWSVDNPMFLDGEDMEGFLSNPDPNPSPQIQMDRIAKSLSHQVEKGVIAALETYESDLVVERVENELTIDLGESVESMDEEEIANLPRESIDILFKKGEIGDNEYANIMRRRFEPEGK